MNSTGLQLGAIGSTKIEDKRNYTSEIEALRSEDLSSVNPARNQEKLLSKVLRTLTTRYPNVVLTGKTGIGKTLTLEFMIEMLSNSGVWNETIEKLSQEEQNLLGTVKERLSNFQRDSYLFLANFNDPKKVKPIVYKDVDLCESETDAVNMLSDDIVGYFANFTVNSFDLLKENFTGNRIGKKFKDDKVFNEFYSGLEDTINSHREEFEENSEIFEWQKQVLNFMKKERKQIERRLSDIYLTQVVFHRTQKGIKEEDKMTLEELLLAPTDTLKSRASDNFDLLNIKRSLMFKLDLGGKEYYVDEIFASNQFKAQTEEEGTLETKCVKFGEFGTGGFIADFKEDDVKPIDEVPHMRIRELGPVFDGGLIYVKDDFSKFIDNICTSEKDSKSKERFLDWLQTGKYVYELEGISYEFDIPRMIVGADNANPFERFENGLRPVQEEGLEARIKTIHVPYVTENNAENRSETIKVILSRIQGLNEASENEIEFDNESINILLNETVIDEKLLSLKYRDLTIRVEELYSYAKSNKQNKVDIETLKKFALDEMPAEFFFYADTAHEDPEVQRLDKANKGFAGGLAFLNDKFGVTIGVKSNLNLNRGRNISGNRFQIVDLESKLADETTHKGFILASQFLMNYLSGFNNKKLLEEGVNWSVSTQFHKTYGMGGPSASTAIAASILSAMSGRKIYRDRHITGTLEPDGIVGQIGGIYAKASAPYRIAQKTGEEQYVIFPSSNLAEITDSLRLDPLNIQEKIHLIPVDTFEQAYAMLASPQIDGNIIDHSHDVGAHMLREDLKVIEKQLNGQYFPKKPMFQTIRNLLNYKLF